MLSTAFTYPRTPVCYARFPHTHVRCHHFYYYFHNGNGGLLGFLRFERHFLLYLNNDDKSHMFFYLLYMLLSSLFALDSRCLTFEYLPFPFAAHASLDVSITLAGFCYLLTMVDSSASLRFERQFPPSQQR